MWDVGDFSVFPIFRFGWQAGSSALVGLETSLNGVLGDGSATKVGSGKHARILALMRCCWSTSYGINPDITMYQMLTSACMYVCNACIFLCTAKTFLYMEPSSTAWYIHVSKQAIHSRQALSDSMWTEVVKLVKQVGLQVRFWWCW